MLKRRLSDGFVVQRRVLSIRSKGRDAPTARMKMAEWMQATRNWQAKKQYASLEESAKPCTVGLQFLLRSSTTAHLQQTCYELEVACIGTVGRF